MHYIQAITGGIKQLHLDRPCSPIEPLTGLMKTEIHESKGCRGYLRVHHGPPRSQVVGCGPSGGGHYQAIPLHMGHKVAITEALQVAQEGRHASVNDHLIQNHLLI